MNAPWFSVALLAALIIGYSMLGSRDDANLDVGAQPTLLGYYVKDAIITETTESGTPRVRFAASEVTQNLKDESVTLTTVRADYLWPAKNENATLSSNPKSNPISNPIPDPTKDLHNHAVNHWVLNADKARVTSTATQNTDRIELRGNVDAHSIDALHNTMLGTQSLDIDTEKQLAQTQDAVRVDIDGHTANGRGLLVDMANNHIQLKSGGTLRLAARTAEAPREPATLSLPDVFEWDSLNFKDNVFLLTKVRSKVEPFISANQARASGTDLANNQFVFSGAVRLELPKQGLLTADSAIVTVRTNRIVNVQLTGAPIDFQHQRSNAQVIYGRATNLDYDVPEETLTIPGQVWFRLDKFEWQQEATEYNLATGEMRGKHGKGTATPHADDQSEPKPAPQPEPK